MKNNSHFLTKLIPPGRLPSLLILHSLKFQGQRNFQKHQPGKTATLFGDKN